MSDGLQVVVCVWDPKHTLLRLESQRRAMGDGTIARLLKKHGEGDDFRSALADAKLTSMRSDDSGEVYCAECNSLMEKVLASPGISDKLEAIRDVAEDFDAAIDRTREAKGMGAW